MREGEKLEASEGGVILIGIRDGVRACVRENTGTIRSDRARGALVWERPWGLRWH